jgi:hypothetical protein
VHRSDWGRGVAWTTLVAVLLLPAPGLAQAPDAAGAPGASAPGDDPAPEPAPEPEAAPEEAPLPEAGADPGEAPTAKPAEPGGYAEMGRKVGNGLAIGFDALIVRPLAVCATITGAILFVPVFIISAAGGAEARDEALELFVTLPAKSVYERPLGDF